jgi:hypothetical protein
LRARCELGRTPTLYGLHYAGKASRAVRVAPLGAWDEAGKGGLTLAQARAYVADLDRMHREGRDIRRMSRSITRARVRRSGRPLRLLRSDIRRLMKPTQAQRDFVACHVRYAEQLMAQGWNVERIARHMREPQCLVLGEHSKKRTAAIWHQRINEDTAVWPQRRRLFPVRWTRANQDGQERSLAEASA